MDVQCDRCKTQYEFDDALVSGKGTTVKCTHCGLQFRVHGSGPSADEWMITTSQGREVTFNSLKALQRAIAAKEVAPEDWLTRGKSGQPRRLSDIAELTPFFQDAIRRSSAPPRRTLTGSPPLPPIRSPDPARSYRPPAEPLRPPVAAPPPGFPPAIVGSGGPPSPVIPPSARLPVISRAPAQPTSGAPKPVRRDPSLPVVRWSALSDADDLRPDDGVRGLPGRRIGGWIIALMLLAGVLVMGVIWLKPYLAATTARPNAVAELDTRAQDFLRAGERALREGDMDTATSDVDKASAIAENDPSVLLGVANVAAVRADVPWLALKLAPPDSADARAATARLADLSRRATGSADQALHAAQDDPHALRAELNAMRIAGRYDEARALLPRVIPIATDPETAYVLAALDLAAPELAVGDPRWRSVVDRLRIAAQGERDMGRARAALIYALVRSSDLSLARAELARLAAAAHPYPLQDALRAFVDASEAPATPAREAQPKAPTVPTAVIARPTPRLATPPLAAPQAIAMPPVGDVKTLIHQGNEAYARRAYDRAARLYAAALDQSPSESEAHGGLGEIARARGDYAGARKSFENALASNRNYMPALIGLADLDWISGDKSSAQKRYKDIVDTFPEGLYPPYVHERAAAAPAPKPEIDIDAGVADAEAHP